jgi:hypothetical protein
MPPMFSHESPHSGPAPIVDADVVDETEVPVPAAETVQVPAAETVQVPAAETVQGVPVLAEVRAIQPHSPASLPAVQAAAVAATGFVAGAATLALVRRHTARKLARARPPRRALDALPIVGSRSFLVDVHLIARDTGGQ